MKNIVLYFILLAGFIPTVSRSQNIGDLFEMDTLILIKNLPYKDINPRHNVLISSNSTHYILYSFMRFKSDSFHFTLISKDKKIIKTYSVKSKVLQTLVNNYEPRSITANTNYIYVSYFNILARFRIIYESGLICSLEFQNVFLLPEPYNYISVKDSNRILCAEVYNNSRADDKQNSVIKQFIFCEEKLVLEMSIYPDFKDIEFSHFNPNHWISNNSQLIVVAQTSFYEIIIYDKSGNKRYALKQNKSGWVQMDEEKISKFRKIIPEDNLGLMIDSLSKYNDKLISRIEGIWFINEDSLLVRYYKYDSTVDFKIRYFDLYRIDEKKAELIGRSMVDYSFSEDINRIITRKNFEMNTWNSRNEIASNEIVIVRNFAPIVPYINRSWRLMKLEEEEYYKGNNPLLTVVIFRLIK